jgi:hypothetical protein
MPAKHTSHTANTWLYFMPYGHFLDNASSTQKQKQKPLKGSLKKARGK